ncbi:ParB N-terminal domain-containing protein [Asticcacaulis sp. BYS171W]|uniref:ParB N-terminal domain-containing protein n=1 Tax=Asticcacaulis aquaticus TaxID=2984212 RepID=A0ABT5HQ14_9CAUL|nr:ParB N-terminal domain-containing protein [Asticcacaulis aquaticus]MDC7682151.1 ParB N-terminal domain-containing protein [Asticcacaulis aquaticus]
MSKLALKPVSTDTVQSGFQTLIPLDRLLKSPDNARKTPHSAAALVALRASIAAKGILQNLIVKPEVDEAGAETGFFHVTAGEGRRLAQIARAKDGEIPRDTPMPCVVRDTDDAHEVSLDENVTREAMTPADQYEAFRALNTDRGMDAAEIAARFGVSEHTVKQRLRLGAVSPVLMQAYRDEKLTLSQLMAYAITEDHARQEAAFDRLKGVYNDAFHIKRLLMEGRVAHTDRRAKLVGMEAYENAGGVIERDLFTEEGGGYFSDAGLLDQLVMQHLAQVAAATRQAEGWKWAEAAIDYPYSNGWGRIYKEPQDLSADDSAALLAAQEALENLVAPFEGADELPDDIDRQAGELEKEIERLEALEDAYLPDDIARGGVFVSLAHDGTVSLTRGLIRAEDEVAEPDDEAAGASETGEDADDETDGLVRNVTATDPDADDDGDIAEDVPLSDILLRDLTTHRTLALRYALAEQPELAARFLVHKLTLDTFYSQRSVTCLDITARRAPIEQFADGLDETPTAAALNTRHEAWAEGLPEDPRELWPHIQKLDAETLGALMAHCTASTVFAVVQPYMPKAAYAASVEMAAHIGLDMTGHWRPTARSYFSRVTKGQIVAAVRQAVGDEAADRLVKLKKPDMAAAAEQLVATTGWLPMCLRTPALPDQDEPLALPAPEETDGLPDLPEAAE